MTAENNGLKAENAELRKERDFYCNQVIENGGRAQRAIDALNDENAKLLERITTQKQTIQAYRDESREWREVAERAQAENAKLREELEQWHRLTAGIELPEYPITEFKPKDLERENAKLREDMEDLEGYDQMLRDRLRQETELQVKAEAENAKLRELVEHLQPIDCEGNVLDIADTVSMLRSEYDGDHEWDDVVVELVLTKWGGDRWIVRGSKGEAWACDCLKTGYDENAYEGSDDAEPIVNPTLIEEENVKLRELVDYMTPIALYAASEQERDRMRELGVEVDG